MSVLAEQLQQLKKQQQELEQRIQKEEDTKKKIK
jgi:hypothetical protein